MYKDTHTHTHIHDNNNDYKNFGSITTMPVINWKMMDYKRWWWCKNWGHWNLILLIRRLKMSDGKIKPGVVSSESGCVFFRQMGGKLN